MNSSNADILLDDVPSSMTNILGHNGADSNKSWKCLLQAAKINLCAWKVTPEKEKENSIIGTKRRRIEFYWCNSQLFGMILLLQSKNPNKTKSTDVIPWWINLKENWRPLCWLIFDEKHFTRSYFVFSSNLVRKFTKSILEKHLFRIVVHTLGETQLK